MEIKTIYFKQFIVFVAVCLVFLFFPQKTLATDGAITLSPQTGNYTNTQAFNISIGIDGGGTPFNAAKATVAISKELSVQDITIGNCDFAFVKTPTQTDPSFAGVILGGSSNACTVYELKLKAISSGTAGISIFDAAVTSYKGAKKIPLSIGYGRYIITGSAPAISAIPSPIESPVLNTSGVKLYNIHFTFPLPKNTPLSTLKVLLDPSLSQERSAIPVLNSENPNSAVAVFEEVPEGVHIIATFHKGTVLSRQVLNISGNNKNLSFGVSAKKPTNVWIWYALAIVVIICVCILGVLLYRRLHQPQRPTS